MAGRSHVDLSRRERQIMDILYRRQRASAAEVHEELPDRPSYSAVRALLRILEEKGHVKHTQDGAKYIYQPTVPRRRAAHAAMRQVVKTFFGGSTEQAVVALLAAGEAKLSPEQLNRLAQLIHQNRDQGR